jgi:hypothetical protein
MQAANDLKHNPDVPYPSPALSNFINGFSKAGFQEYENRMS